MSDIKAVISTSLSDAVSTEITEKNVHKEQEREREHFVWVEVMEIHDGKNKNKRKELKSLLNPPSGLNPSVFTFYWHTLTDAL